MRWLNLSQIDAAVLNGIRFSGLLFSRTRYIALCPAYKINAVQDEPSVRCKSPQKFSEIICTVFRIWNPIRVI